MSEETGDATSDEVARLRAEVAQLRAEKAQTTASPSQSESPSGRDRQWWRTIVVAVLIVLVGIIAPLSVVATWAHDEIGDTDRYVDTVAPLASDPAVQSAIASRVSKEIFDYIDVDKVTKEALTALSQQQFVPDRAGALLPALSVPLTNAVEGFVEDRVDALVRSSAFEQAWVEANRQAHAQMVNVLTGESDGSSDVSVSDDGTVRINLAATIEVVKKNLVDRGFSVASQIPEINASFVIFQAKNLGAARTYVGWLDTAARALPILGLVLLVSAVMIARDRRKALLAGALAVALSMILLGFALTSLRPLYLNAVPEDVLPTSAAAAIYDQVVYFMRTALRAVGFVALAVAAAAFLFAPTGAGAAVRSGFGAGMGRLRNRTGLDTGPVGEFLGTYRTFTRVVVVAIGALWYLALDHPTGASALTIIAVVVVALIILEFLAGPRTVDPEEEKIQEGTSR